MAVIGDKSWEELIRKLYEGLNPKSKFFHSVELIWPGNG